MSPPGGTPQGPARPDGDEEVDHLRSIPWCAAHLSAPGLTVAPVLSRTPKPRHEDALFARTLRTPDTVRALACFYHPPRPAEGAGSAAGAGADEAGARGLLLLPEVRALASLGDLVSGYAGVAHGGVVACLFDELLSLVHPGSRRGAGGGAAGVVTAYLNTVYLRPVEVPGVYLIVVRLKKAEGRKIFVGGWMEDERGEKLARAEALFVEAREKL